MKQYPSCTTISLFSHSSHIVRLVSTLLVFVATCFGVSLLANDAQAQDNPWEVTVGGGYGGAVDTEWVHDSYPTHLDHGFTVMATAGYRFKSWISLNLEQSLIRGYSRDDIDHMNYDYGGDESYESWTLGETAATVKFLYTTDNKVFEMYAKIGLGAIYGAFYNSRDINKDSLGSDNTGIGMIIPMGIGANVYFDEHFGIGFDAQFDSYMIILEGGQFKATAHLAMRF